MAINDIYPIFGGEAALTAAREDLLGMHADLAPVDVTQETTLPLTDGRVVLGATAMPPSVWLETTTFTRDGQGPAKAHHDRLTFTTDATGDIQVDRRKYSGPIVNGRTEVERSVPSKLEGVDRRTAFQQMIGYTLNKKAVLVE
jgi:hypothetical protein